MRLPFKMRREGLSWSARRFILAAFFTSFGLVLAVFMLAGVAPFGDKILCFSDAYNQYIAFWAYFRNVLLGKQDGLYSLAMTLGGNVTGVFAYYSASIFNLLFLLFPQELLPIAMHLIILLKISCSGMALAIYFRHTDGYDARRLLLTAAYSLCAYSSMYFWCAMWLDGLILLPLIALGLRRIANGGLPWLYIFSLAAAIWANYYIGFMLCIFSVLYFIYSLWIWGGSRLIKSSGVFCLSSLAAGALPAVLLIPTVFAMSGGKREGFWGLFTEYTYTTALKVLGFICPARSAEFDRLVKYVLLAALLIFAAVFAVLVIILFSRRLRPWAKLLACGLFAVLLLGYGAVFEPQEPFLQKLLVGFTGFDEMQDGMPGIYSGLLPLVLAPAYFVDRSISSRERAGTAVLGFVLLVCMRFYIPNLMWHGFTLNNCFNFRYSFTFSFVLICAASRAIDGADRHRLRFWGVVLCAVAFLIWLGHISHPKLAEGWQYAVIFAVCALMCAALYFGALRRDKPKRLAAAVLAVLSLITTAYPLWSNILDYSRRDSFLSMKSYRADTVARLSIASSIVRQSNEVCRASIDRNTNSPMAYGIGGAGHFSSAERSDVVRFLGALGTSHTNAWASIVFSRSRALDSFLGIRYLTENALAVGCSEGYIPIDGTSLLENTFALPIAFSADTGVEASIINEEDPFLAINGIFRALRPEVELDIFRPAGHSAPTLTGLEPTQSGCYAAVSQDGSLQFDLNITSSDPLYLYIADGRQHSAIVYLNGEYIAARNDPHSWAPLFLGCFDVGSSITVELKSDPVSDSEMGGDVRFYHENGDALAAYVAAIRAQKSVTESDTDSHLLTHACVSSHSYLLYTIPYDDGWQILVDGEPAAAKKAFGLLLAVDTGSGEHIVEMRYTPPWLKLGAAISLASVLAVLSAFICVKRQKDS